MNHWDPTTNSWTNWKDRREGQKRVGIANRSSRPSKDACGTYFQDSLGNQILSIGTSYEIDDDDEHEGHTGHHNEVEVNRQHLRR
jgi:hypothetical protein